MYAVGASADYVNWFWALGDGVAFNHSWQLMSIPDDPTWRPICDGDFAFELSTDCVPEQASLTLLALGLLGLAVHRRKK